MSGYNLQFYFTRAKKTTKKKLEQTQGPLVEKGPEKKGSLLIYACM